ncbi:hypothetical protein EV126DRAFT_203766 [Verticillium dahliae]|nr:hypothetical protein EV126DRAFT_203766 [Verticillium dahliae]
MGCTGAGRRKSRNTVLLIMLGKVPTVRCTCRPRHRHTNRARYVAHQQAWRPMYRSLIHTQHCIAWDGPGSQRVV